MRKIFFIAALIFFCGSMPEVFANQIIPGKQIEVMAVDEVEKILRERGEYRRHEIILMRNLSNIKVPPGVIDIQILLPSASLSYHGRRKGLSRCNFRRFGENL